jgi:hypothetical protein
MQLAGQAPLTNGRLQQGKEASDLNERSKQALAQPDLQPAHSNGEQPAPYPRSHSTSAGLA